MGRNPAIGLIRAKVYGEFQARSADANAMASFIAASVPLFDCGASQTPRLLQREEREGVFVEGGAELRFLDGRPAKRHLAVHPDDVACLIAMLKDPGNALHARCQAVRSTSRKLRDQSKALLHEAGQLRAESKALHAGAPRGPVSG